MRMFCGFCVILTASSVYYSLVLTNDRTVPLTHFRSLGGQESNLGYIGSPLDAKHNNSSSTAPSKAKRYHELQEQIATRASTHSRHLSESAYNRATVVEKDPSWFTPKKLCKESCCAQTVAISLLQDEHQIINTLDGIDLADIHLQHYTNPSHLEFHSSILDERILPCLQPGTIIHLDNYPKIIKYFFGQVRHNITVPFVLITSETDYGSPVLYGDKVEEDHLILKWYGTNLNINTPRPIFVPFPLGLSKHHPQDEYLSRYLSLTNFTNPFTDKSRWTSRLADLSMKDLFVNFGTYKHSEHRMLIKDALCKHQKSKDGISCGEGYAAPSDVYAAASEVSFAPFVHPSKSVITTSLNLMLLGFVSLLVLVRSKPPRSWLRLLPHIRVVALGCDTCD